MPDRIRSAARGTAGLILGALMSVAVLSGCSTAESTLTVFADPGKYEYHSCEQLAVERKKLAERHQELTLLMDKAEQSTGGTLVNALAYKADRVAAGEELKLIELAARAKNCETPANWRSNSAVR
jgi:hypothetical protein